MAAPDGSALTALVAECDIVCPAPGVPEAFADIGIRIEDDALVTDSGCEILSAAAPKSIADIETLMRNRHG